MKLFEFVMQFTLLAKEGCLLQMRTLLIVLVPEAMWAQLELLNLIQIHFIQIITLVVEVVPPAECALHIFGFCTNFSIIGMSSKGFPWFFTPF